MSSSLELAVTAALTPSSAARSVVIACDASVAAPGTAERCRDAAAAIRAQGEAVTLVIVREPGARS